MLLLIWSILRKLYIERNEPMSNVQSVFKRVEKKYMVNETQYHKLMQRFEGRMQVDKYGKTTICNIYYDTPSHQLIRNSLEKPVYKEKLRVRSYGTPDEDGRVFVELKKKYKGVVYKRRVDMTLAQSRSFMRGAGAPSVNPQIENEISYFLDFYKGIAPAMFLSYERIALCGVKNPDLRVTFDSRITYREEELSLEKGVWGKQLLEPGHMIMEIKIPGAMPLWLSEILDELKIFPTTFSKYGTAYMRECKNELKSGKVIDCA